MKIINIFSKIFRRIYHWCTKTRLRKILSSILAFLILLTSIKYIFIYPQSAKAADVFIKLDEGYGTTPKDTNSTVSAGTITNATWQKEDLCKVGKCLYFDGTGDYVSYAHNTNLDMGSGNTVTVEGWFRTPDITSGTRTLISKEEATGADGGYRIEMNSSGFIRFGIDNDNTLFPSDSVTSTVAYDDNAWHQFAAVKDGGTSITLYIDGVSVGTPDSSIQNDVSNTDPFYIGSYFDVSASNGFSGFMDEIKVLRTARTAAEVKADYAGETPSRGASASFTPDQAYISNGLVGYWKMDEAAWGTPNCSTDVVFDSSGNSNNADACPNSTGPTGGNSGKFGRGIDFDGSDDYLTIPSSTSNNVTSSFTFSIWIYQTGAQTQDVKRFFYKAGTTTGFIFGTGEGTGNDLSVWLESVNIVDSAEVITNNEWQHVAATFDGKRVVIYRNGVNVGEGTHDGPLPGNSSALEIGGNVSHSLRHFDGLLDDARMYNRALSSTEIESLYKWSPGPVGYWKLDENTGTTANDSSTNGNTGTLSGTPTPSWATGKYGSGNSFNGSTAYVDAGSGSSLQITNNLTLSAWIKLTSNSTTQDIIARNGSSGSYNYRLYINSSGQLVMEVSSDGTAVTTATGATTLSIGTWYHVAGVYVPSTSITVYVNGVQDGQNTTSIPSSINNTSSVALKLGAENTGSTSSGATFVQECPNGSGSTSSLVITCATTGGNLLVLMFQYNAGSSRDFTVADTGGNTWTVGTNRIYDNRPSGIVNGGQVFYSKTSSNNTTVTITITGGAVGIEASLVEFSGIQSSPLDVSSGNQCNDATPTNCSTSMTSNATATTAQADEVAVGFLGLSNTNSITGTGSGWTYRTKVDNGATVSVMAGYKILTSTGTQTNTGTAGSNDNWNAFVATFKSNTSSSGNNFSGSMDDAKVYNYDRSPGQIIEDMNAGHPAPGSPVGSAVGSWKFDEGYGDTAYDSSPQGNNANLAGSSAACPTGADDGCPSWTNSGKFDKALTFSKTGVDDYIEIPDDSSLRPENGSWTVSFWANPANADQGGSFISKDQTTGDFERWTVFMCGDITCSISGQLLWANFRQSGTVYRSALSTNDIADGSWHQYAAVFDKNNDKVRLFMDGRELTTTTATSGVWPTVNNTDVLRIAGQNTAGNFIETSMDEVQIYNSALSTDQIKILYNRGSGAVMGAVSTDTSGNASFSSQRVYCPPGNAEGNCSSGEPSPLGEWKLDENTGTSAFDTSGNSFTGTLTAGPTWTTGKNGAAVKFDGTDDYVDMGDQNTLDIGDTDDFTISAWFNITSLAADSVVVTKSSSRTTGDSYMIYIHNTDGKVRFKVGDGTNYYLVESATSVSVNTWYHVTGVWDQDSATNTEIYINGIDDNGTDTCTTACTITTIGDASTTNTFRLGSEAGTPAQFFPGSIDQVRFYKYVRTPAQITWDYNQGKPIAHWKMDEASWNGTAGEVKDSSGNGLTGAAAGNATTTTSGKYNNAGTFDGTGDYFDATYNSKMDITGDFTLAAWVNLSTASVGNQFIITKRSGTGGGGGYDIAMGNASEIFCQTDDGATTTSSSTPTGIITTGAGWQHIAAVRSGTSCRIYIDGVDRTSSAGTHTTLGTNTNAIRVGGNLNNSEYWHGQIDDARIYNYAMSSQQVKAMMNESAALRYGP